MIWVDEWKIKSNDCSYCMHLPPNFCICAFDQTITSFTFDNFILKKTSNFALVIAKIEKLLPYVKKKNICFNLFVHFFMILGSSFVTGSWYPLFYFLCETICFKKQQHNVYFWCGGDSWMGPVFSRDPSGPYKIYWCLF